MRSAQRRSRSSSSLGGAVDGGQVMLGHGDDAELGEQGDPGLLDPRAGVELTVSDLPVRVLGGPGGKLLDFTRVEPAGLACPAARRVRGAGRGCGVDLPLVASPARARRPAAPVGPPAAGRGQVQGLDLHPEFGGDQGTGRIGVAACLVPVEHVPGRRGDPGRRRRSGPTSGTGPVIAGLISTPALVLSQPARVMRLRSTGPRHAVPRLPRLTAAHLRDGRAVPRTRWRSARAGPGQRTPRCPRSPRSPRTGSSPGRGVGRRLPGGIGLAR